MLEISNALQSAMEHGERVAPSSLAHHGKPCCARARAWFLLMDRFFHANNHAVPVWIRLHWEWGPSRWPMYWCEAMEAKKLDCGVLAFLTLETLKTRGARAFLCQLVQKFDGRTIEQWRKAWGDAGVTPDFAVGEYAYHESCAIVKGEEFAVWDSTTNAPVKPTARGYGGVVALRLRSADPGQGPLYWGHLPVSVNEWLMLEEGLPPGQERVCAFEPVSAWPLVWTPQQSVTALAIRQ